MSYFQTVLIDNSLSWQLRLLVQQHERQQTTATSTTSSASLPSIISFHSKQITRTAFRTSESQIARSFQAYEYEDRFTFHFWRRWYERSSTTIHSVDLQSIHSVDLFSRSSVDSFSRFSRSIQFHSVDPPSIRSAEKRPVENRSWKREIPSFLTVFILFFEPNQVENTKRTCRTNLLISPNYLSIPIKQHDNNEPYQCSKLPASAL